MGFKFTQEEITDMRRVTEIIKDRAFRLESWEIERLIAALTAIEQRDAEIARLTEKLNLIDVVAFDYDGYRDADGLMKLVDELREIARSALKSTGGGDD